MLLPKKGGAYSGTATLAFKDILFPVAGKTGTTRISDGKIRYEDGIYEASFAGYFPANDPQYTCIVSIRTVPHDPNHYGATLAAPVFREIAEDIHKFLGFKKNSK